MKPKILLAFFLAVIVILSTSFVICEKEENLKPEFTLFQNDPCFAEFLSNLKKMEALIFIPENKLKLAESLNLVPVAPDRAKSLNVNYTKAYEFYGLVRPSDNPTVECNKSVQLNFDNLEMMVFVKNDRLKNITDNLKIKLDVGKPLNPKLIDLNNAGSEKLKIKLTNSGEWKDYIPVELK